jgi:hypothetical protein
MWYRSDLDELRFASGTSYDKVAMIPKIPLGAPIRALFWFRSSWLPDGCERVMLLNSGYRNFYSDFLVLATGTTGGGYASLEKDWDRTFSSWSKRRVISLLVEFTNITYTRDQIFTGKFFKVSTSPCFGVYVDNNSSNTSPTLYGFSWDGSASTDISLCTVSEGNHYLITVEFVPDESIKFYVNNTLAGTITSNLPSGTAEAYGALRARIYNYEAVDKQLKIYQVACTQEL